MHPNPAFRKADAARNIAFARERAFGVLAVNAEGGPVLAHVPFQLSDNGGADGAAFGAVQPDCAGCCRVGNVRR